MSNPDASLALKKAIIAKLKVGSAIAGGRNYDRPTASPTFPYTSLGPFDVLTEIADEYAGGDTSIQIDGWSRGTGATVASVEIMQIGAAIHGALHEQSLTLEGDQRLVDLTVESVRYSRDPDGLTEHAIVTVRARTEPTA